MSRWTAGAPAEPGDEQRELSERARRKVFPSPRTYFADAAEFLEGSRCRIRILLLDVLGEECSKDIETLRRDCALLHVGLVGDVIGLWPIGAR